MSSRRPYKLDRVAIRMVKEPPLYSSEPLRSPEAAVKVIADMLRQYDRSFPDQYEYREYRDAECVPCSSQGDLKERCALQCECHDAVS